MPRFRTAWLSALACLTLSAQTLSNKSLTGKYWFRELLISTDSGTQVQTLFGSLTFDGNGGFTYSAQLLAGASAPANSSGANGAYSVQPGGQATLSDPLRTGTQV